mgnify:CR=1 FL=1
MKNALNDILGKTIKTAKIVCHKKEGCDGENLLTLEMTDGSIFYIEGGYGGYTGKSCDEYFEWVGVKTEHDFS